MFASADGAVLSESIFARYVIPKIVELFKSRLIHVRVVVLKNFSKFVHLFEESVLKDVVLPEVGPCDVLFLFKACCASGYG